MSTKLSDTALIKSQQSTFENSAAIQNYVATILKQPPIELDEMPTLPEHQKTARAHASKWNDDVRPGMIATCTDIIDYANTFESFYENARELADKVTTDPQARKEFIATLTYLKTNIMRKQSAAKEVLLSLKNFQADLNEDYTVFLADAKKATDLYVGNSGEIAKIEGEIQTTQDYINKQIAIMASSGAGILAGIVAICVGVFAEIATAGLSNGLILAGIGLTTGGISGEIAGGVEFAEAINKMVCLKNKLADDKQGLMAVKVVKGQLNGIVDQLHDAVTAAGNLVDTWQSLDTSIGKLIDDINTDPGKEGPQLKAMLNIARTDWQNTLALAKKMQPTGKLEVQHYNNLQDAIKVSSG